MLLAQPVYWRLPGRNFCRAVLFRLSPASERTYKTIYQRPLPGRDDPVPALQRANVSDLSFRWLHSLKNYGIMVQDFHFDDLWLGTAIGRIEDRMPENTCPRSGKFRHCAGDLKNIIRANVSLQKIRQVPCQESYRVWRRLVKVKLLSNAVPPIGRGSSPLLWGSSARVGYSTRCSRRVEHAC